MLNDILTELQYDPHQDEDYMKEYWMKTIENIALINPKLECYYEFKQSSDLDILIDGDSGKPDIDAVNHASNIIENLPKYYKIFDDTVGFNFGEDWWGLSSIGIINQKPWKIFHEYKKNFEEIRLELQSKNICYLHVWSEYGADIILYIIETEDGDIYTADLEYLNRESHTIRTRKLEKYYPKKDNDLNEQKSWWKLW